MYTGKAGDWTTVCLVLAGQLALSPVPEKCLYKDKGSIEMVLQKDLLE